MKLATKVINVRGEALHLTNLRAIFWEREKSLILSDLHIGKTAHFRKHGIPIPDKVLHQDLKQLELLLKEFNPLKLIVVGDLFHAESNTDTQFFSDWISSYQGLELVLIKGNHDRISWQKVEGIDFKSVKSLELEPFKFVHNPEDVSNPKNFSIVGHIHPGVQLKGRGKQRLKLPCYQLSKNLLILPAFSKFTGLNTHANKKEDVYYAFTEEEIFKL